MADMTRGWLLLLPVVFSSMEALAASDHKLCRNPTPYPAYPPGGYKSGAKPIPGFKVGAERNDIVPGELVADPPTLENLGFRWYIEGDTNRNASVCVSYRKEGDSEWRQALPMLRVHHEIAGLPNRGAWRAGNLFAGSVMFLEPGTRYEIKFVMTDPDGGAPPSKTVAAATRPEPKAFEEGRTLHVYPNPKDGAYTDLLKAYEAAKPGDVILIHGGTYRGSYRLTKSGEPGKPIVFRDAGDGDSVLEADGIEGDFPKDAPASTKGLFDIDGTNYLHFENLTLRRDGIAGGQKHDRGSVGIVVRRCKILDVVGWCGISTGSESSANWYLADNVLTGVDVSWHPYRTKGKSTGINLYGRGHVACYNRISGFGDSIAIYNYGPPPEDIAKHCVAIDIYNNDLSHAWDDNIEADYGVHNVRVYRNRCRNAHTGLSVQPFFGGPVYLIRNEVYAVTNLTFKLNCFPTGIEAYNNTVCAATCAGHLGYAQNMHFRNNLLMGGDAERFVECMKDEKARERMRRRVAHALWGGTLTPSRSTMDYDGYYSGVGQQTPFANWRHGRNAKKCATLQEFVAFTGYEKHGLIVGYDIFQNAGPPGYGKTYDAGQYDLRLKPGAKAVDAGMALPNVTDGHTGKAPDLGCHEVGAPRPHYGPRKEGRSQSGK